MWFEEEIKSDVVAAVQSLFGATLANEDVATQQTNPDFAGDLTVVIFKLTKVSRLSPEKTAEAIGSYLNENSHLVVAYNVVKGFLNLVLNESEYVNAFNNIYSKPNFGIKTEYTGAPVLVEYSSPNTNKPLHLGHIRNNLLGYSVHKILKAFGKNVVKVNIVNDRGIHICKSMVAWSDYGNGETPESSGIKGDHLVGKYYVEFDKHYKAQINELVKGGMEEKKAKQEAPIYKKAQDVLRKWEANDADVIKQWKMMNDWVYAGFDVTYKRLGVDFDKIYYESETYLLGKEIVEDGLKSGVLFTKEDGSVWANLEDEGLDQKLLLRGDGTAVYMTQDLGTAKQRYDEYKFDQLVYVVGNEQDYHFKVLKLILKKLGYEWSDKLYHLSYNMVDLPSGKMKSREGTVVDADDLIDQMIAEAEKITKELGKLDDFNSAEAKDLYTTIGMGALKYFMLKVDPEKRMLFNPEESIEFTGNTGPFIQYTHARIKSVIAKALQNTDFKDFDKNPISNKELEPKEKLLLKTISLFSDSVSEAATRLSPAVISNYLYDLAKTFNQFYQECPIVDDSNINQSVLRLQLSDQCARNIKSGMDLLGIEVPERM